MSPKITMTDSIRVSFSPNPAPRGTPVAIAIEGVPDVRRQHIQVELFTAGVANPFSKIGFGRPLVVDATNTFRTSLDTTDLPDGLYEVRLLRMHSSADGGDVPPIDFISGRDFGRSILAIADASAPRHTPAELLEVVDRLESEIESRFLAPVDIRKTSSPGEEYAGFVFVRDVLVGKRMRFSHCEIVPTGAGLDRDDELNFVNTFLRDGTHTGIRFDEDASVREQNRRTNPVAVLYFPAIIAATAEDARDHCVEQTNVALLALALARDAGGSVFDTVIVSCATGRAIKFAVHHPYVGNLLTGDMSGEHFDSVNSYVEGIRADPLNRFLVSLYLEARREKSRDFQYVRYWQLLETMAERRNYDPAHPLLDYSGGEMTDNGQPRLLKGAVNIVFNLLRESCIGDTVQAWKHVNVWFAFRNAVAHHGAISQYHLLGRKSVREWAESGHRELAASPEIDPFLWALKEDVKLLLMRRLVDSARAVADAST